jgi:hypothetical protein
MNVEASNFWSFYQAKTKGEGRPFQHLVRHAADRNRTGVSRHHHRRDQACVDCLLPWCLGIVSDDPLRNVAYADWDDLLEMKRAAQGGPFAHMWMARLSTANAASRTASDNVGCAWQVRARSSDEPPNSISTAASWINSPAPIPMM